MSEGEDDATVNLVVSWTSLLPGDLFDCRNSSDDDSTCVGGVAATDAFARYYAKQQTANNETTTAAAAAEDGIPTLVLSYVDTISPFVQMHPLGWSLNRLVFNHLLGWNVCLSSPSILTQNSIDYQISQRDISDLQTLDMPLLLSNVFVPPGNSWFEYIKAVHFDTSTGLAVISIYNSKGLLNVNQIDTAKGVLNFIQQTNTESGCVDSTSLYSRYANETTRTTLSRCYLPVVLFEDASSDQFDAFVEAIVLHDYPPALIIDTTGNQANFSQPTRMGPSDDVWVHSFSLDQASYNQHTLTYSPDGTVLRNVSFSTEEFAALPEEARDETYRVNLAYLRALADEALESDPVVGTSGFMPLHRDNNIYRRCNGGECELGNLFADALRWSTDADVAFIKSGGFRGEGWPAGNVTISDIWRSLPFPNT